ncbi:MAG: pilus assembly protein TadG-related protein [Bifidobacteriaceae bacterium]|jgi:secretion/DNA translocation related TadE-like protein|nr:pilus assembly protein TadG-related protein [Bifidobacteriaceae bacterium]
MRGRERTDLDRGSGTVLAIGLVAALATVALALATLAGALVGRERAVAAADLAALAGAQALIDGHGLPESCQAAAAIAQAMGAELTECARIPPDRLTAACRIGIDLPLLGRRIAEAEAVAGPP